MSALAMIFGKLFGEPVIRDTKSGGKVAFFKLRVVNGAALEIWDCATFSESARDELASLRGGDAVSAVGALRIEPYEYGDSRGFNRRLTADRVMALKRAQSDAKPRRAAPKPRSGPRSRRDVLSRDHARREEGFR